MGLYRVNGLRAGGFLVATLCAFAGTASAFDTGPHFDITEDVLRSEWFSTTAIQTVQSANFFVDFYEFMGTSGPRKLEAGDCLAKADSILKIADAQHFDDLDSTRMVAEKWDAMLAGTKAAAEAKTKAGDVLGLLALLGMSLHNVQDFYAHSNWVDGDTLGPPLGKGALAKYGDHPTWLSMDRKDREALNVYTKHYPPPSRTHGAWDARPESLGLNKDWAGRPHYRDAYICAWFASRQWVRLFHTWVTDPNMWSQMQRWSTKSFDPGRDWDYARKISFYGGHWYGNGALTGFKDAFKSRTAATSPDLLVPAVLRFMGGRCITKNPSALRSKAVDLLGTWGKMPYRGPVPVTLPSAAPESVQFAQLKVHRIDATDADDGPGGGQMDWFCRVQLGTQRFMSGLIDEHDHFNFDVWPYYPWTMIKEIPAGMNSVLVRFELYDLDYKNDDLIDINPKSKAESLVFNYLPALNQVRGEVTGKPRFVVEGHGDCDCAKVDMEVGQMAATCLK